MINVRILNCALLGLSVAFSGCSSSTELPGCDDSWLHDAARQAIIDTYLQYGLPAANESVKHLTNSVKNMEALSPDMDDMVRREQLSKFSQVRDDFTLQDIAVCRAEYIEDTAYMLITALRNPDNHNDIGVIVQNIGTPAGSPGLYGWIKDER